MARATSDERYGNLEMTAAEFREIGHSLVDRLAAFVESLPERPIAEPRGIARIRDALGRGTLPEEGAPAETLLEQACNLLEAHSTLVQHPRFFGFIPGAAASIGAFADLVSATFNPIVSGFRVAPVATEIETQTVRWLAELIGYPTQSEGLLVSGGTMANFIALLVARRAKATWDVRTEGLHGGQSQPLCVYASTETHTWIEKAVDIFGLGKRALRSIPCDANQRIDVAALEAAIEQDRTEGRLPLMVVASAGTISTGAIDPIRSLAEVCRRTGTWFHVDGAYGAFAARTRFADEHLAALGQADSVALDPHKWLYVPHEAGCILVKQPALLRDTFSYTPPYYVSRAPERSDEAPPIHYYQLGPQNSRAFRALKVWLALRRNGRVGYTQSIEHDIELARYLHQRVTDTHELEPLLQGLSISTFRYVPADLPSTDTEAKEKYLNELNAEVLRQVQDGGEVFLSNAIVGGVFALRACVLNFRTRKHDVEAVPSVVVRVGRAVDATLRPASLRS